MNNFLILGAIISVFMFPLQSLAGEREELQEIYSDMYRYMIAKDVSQLGNLLDDSFILVHMTGMKQTKKEYLTSIQNGTLNYFSGELEYFDAQISDDSAVIVGQSRVNAAVFGGGRHTWRLELNIKLNKKNGQWLMTEARASTY